MFAVTDPYKILQVDPDAEPEVIRAAYRALALKYHPDLSSASEDRMASLNQAWAILRDAACRAAFDQTRAEAKRAAEAPKPAPVREQQAPAFTPPPGKQSGSVLDFGRYAGWSLGQLAPADPDYLLWLVRTPIGRPYYAEIRELLESHPAARPASAPHRPGQATGRRRSRFGRG